MARIDWIEARLLNWSRSRLSRGGGALGYAGVDLSNPTPGVREPYAEAPIPINDVEADETESAIHLLPGELRATIIEFYIEPGGERDHLKRLVCSKSTMHARIGRAHRLLAEHFLAKQDRQRVERERVEALQRSRKLAGSFTP